MTVWTHDLLDALRQIGDPPLDEVDKIASGPGGAPHTRPAADEQGDPGRRRFPMRSGSSAPGVGLANGEADHG